MAKSDNVIHYIQDCCSFETEIKGVMFYSGRRQLYTFSRLTFERDPKNSHHEHAFFAKVEGDVLGHVTWEVAEALNLLCVIPNIKIIG